MNNTNKMRRRLILIVSGVAIVAIIVISCLIIGGFWKAYQIRQMDRGFSRVNIGDESSLVIQLLGTPCSVQHDDSMSWLGLVPEKLSIRCTKQWIYNIDTFYLPFTWIVFFDDQDRVIHKMRLS